MKRLASGGVAAEQTPEQTLERLVMANMLGQDLAYIDGQSNMLAIAEAVANSSARAVARLAIKARWLGLMRDVPVFLAIEMLKYPKHKLWVGDLLPQVITRPDQMSRALQMYGKKPLAKQLKLGLAKAFGNFDEYQLAKYKNSHPFTLRDVMRLVHPKPPKGKEALYRAVADGSLKPADTWEVALSAGADKKATFTRLLQEKRLGALALLRNISGMVSAGVSPQLIADALEAHPMRGVLPTQIVQAFHSAPSFRRSLEKAMLKGLEGFPRLPGKTVVAVDMSGSMINPLSDNSVVNRLDAAAALAMMLVEVSDESVVYATASTHSRVVTHRGMGFELMDALHKQKVGNDGIFTARVLDHIAKNENDIERIVVLCDSQDCEYPPIPLKPKGRRNYIVDVSAHELGVGHNGVWAAEISGMSDYVVHYIAYLEGFVGPQLEDYV